MEREKTIENLPADVITLILSSLPIKVAGRTCVLSSKWLSHWRKMSKLVFDSDSFEVEQLGQLGHHRCKFFYAISQILLHHEGSISEFSLKVTDHEDHQNNIEVDSCISYLSKKNKLQSFTLDTTEGHGHYRIPSSLYKLEGLNHLSLIWSDISHVPTSFKGFPRLSTLILKTVNTEIRSLVFLLKGCPLLKSLTLDTHDIETNGQSTITSLLDCFVSLEFLSIFYLLIKKINLGRKVPKVLKNPLFHLKVLHMHELRVSDKLMLPVLLLLINSSPNLEELKMEFNDQGNDEDQFVWSCKATDFPDLTLGHLSHFEVCNLSYTEREIDVLRLVLAKSPVLKEVMVVGSLYLEEEEQEEIAEAMYNLKCASSFVSFTLKFPFLLDGEEEFECIYFTWPA